MISIVFLIVMVLFFGIAGSIALGLTAGLILAGMILPVALFHKVPQRWLRRGLYLACWTPSWAAVFMLDDQYHSTSFVQGLIPAVIGAALLLVMWRWYDSATAPRRPQTAPPVPQQWTYDPDALIAEAAKKEREMRVQAVHH